LFFIQLGEDMKRFFFVIVLIVGIILTACQPIQNQVGGNLVFTDGLGRTVNLTHLPTRIVSLAPSNTEILFAVGAGKLLVGRDDFSDYPEETQTIPAIGGSMGKYNLEQVVDLKPDIILAAEINTPEQVRALEDLGMTVYYLSNPTDLDGLYANLITVGELTGNSRQSEILVTGLKSRTSLALSSRKPDQGLRVFYELDGSDPAKPWTSGKGSFIDMLLTMAGAENVAAAAGEGWLQISQETLVAADPQIILLGDAAYGTTSESVGSRAGWSGISAVKEGRIYAFDDNLVSRPGPRLIDGLEALVMILNQQ
jgi:iron complex transport system substrate-binding protein